MYLGALGPAMTELGWEIADGLILHRFLSERYLREVTVPSLGRGLARSKRTASQVEVVFPEFVLDSTSEVSYPRTKDDGRGEIGFYGSAHSYHRALEVS